MITSAKAWAEARSLSGRPQNENMSPMRIRSSAIPASMARPAENFSRLGEPENGLRFEIRAIAVIEGVGDHGCEYMTGGVVLVLGRTGKNFGAGMTGGVAYVLDEHERLPINLNRELVHALPLEDPVDITLVKKLIYKHLERTDSELAQSILADWNIHEEKFRKIIPIPLAPKAPAVTEPAAAPAAKE